MQLLAQLEDSDPAPDDVALRARDRLCAQLDSPPSLGGLAHAVGSTPRALNAALRDRYGLTAFALLQQERVASAKIQLQVTETPVGRLGLELGFSSPSHFSRVFRAHTGMSPSTFRRVGAWR